MTEKNRGKQPHNKTLKIKKYSNLIKQNKETNKKGVHYSFEKVKVMSNQPGIKGDIVKKYIDGDLKEQKFVTEDKMKELIDKNNQKGGKRKGKGKAKTNKVKVIVVQDGTTMGHAAATGVGHGAGFAIGHSIVQSVISGIFGDRD